MISSHVARSFGHLLSSFTKLQRWTAGSATAMGERRLTINVKSLEPRILMSATPLAMVMEGAAGESEQTDADWSIDIDFSDETGTDMQRVSGDWTISEGAYHAIPDGAALSLLSGNPTLPADLQFSATINADAAAGTFYSNAFIIFDYQSTTNFKFAGAYTGSSEWVIGHRNLGGWITDSSSAGDITAGNDYQLTLTIHDDSRATLYVDGQAVVADSFGSSLTDGQLGVGTRNAVSYFDNVTGHELHQHNSVATAHLPVVEDFDDGTADALNPQNGVWATTLGRYTVIPEVDTDGLSLMALRDDLPQDVIVAATVNMDEHDSARFSNAFIVFDYHSDTDFKFAGAFTARDEWSIGHRSDEGWLVDATVSAPIDAFTDYELVVTIDDGHSVSMSVGDIQVDHQFADDVTDGQLGLGTYNGVARFDNVSVTDPNFQPKQSTVSVQVEGEQLVVSSESDSELTILLTNENTIQISDYGQLIDTHENLRGNLVLRLGDGNDNVTIDLGGHRLARHLIVDLGAGDDLLNITHGQIEGHAVVHGGEGDDRLTIAADASINRHAKLRLGDGNDRLEWLGDVRRSLWIQADAGDDHVLLAGTIQRSLFAHLGQGDDTVDVSPDARIGHFSLFAMGAGDDTFDATDFNPVRLDHHQGDLIALIGERHDNGHDRADHRIGKLNKRCRFD